MLAGLDLDGAVAAGRLDEFPDGPAGLRFDPAADGERCEDDRSSPKDTRTRIAPAVITMANAPA